MTNPSIKPGTRIKLTGRNPKGAGLLKLHTPNWVVLEVHNEVGFSPRPGPWLYLNADSNNEARLWVHLTDDRSFIVEIPATVV